MKLTSNNDTLAINKVIILYILNTLDKSISNDKLFQLILAFEDVNYFYYQQFLLDLLENKYIESYTDGEYSEQNYKITNLGKDVLELTKDMLPGIIKLKIDTCLKVELQNIKEEISLISEFFPESDDAFTITCKIVENNKTTFEVSTFAASREQAKFICDNWKKNAVNIYPQILNLLTKENFY